MTHTETACCGRRAFEDLFRVVIERMEDGSLDVLGVYDGHDLPGRSDYGYVQLPDRIVLFRAFIRDVH